MPEDPAQCPAVTACMANSGAAKAGSGTAARRRLDLGKAIRWKRADAMDELKIFPRALLSWIRQMLIKVGHSEIVEILKTATPPKRDAELVALTLAVWMRSPRRDIEGNA